MPNRGQVTGTISTKAGVYTIQNGYHDGSGTVSIASTEAAKIIAGNIKSGVSILGVTGTYSGEAISVEANKNVTPSTTSQTITPSSGYDYLAFLQDGESKFLYNVSTGETKFTIQALKFYKTDIQQEYVFVKKDGFWGIYSLIYDTWFVNPQQYKYVGLIDTADENGVLDGSSLIAEDEDGYRIMQFNSDMRLENVSVNYKYPIYTYDIDKQFVAFDNSRSCSYSQESGDNEIDINIRNTCLNIYPFESIDPIIDDATAIKVFQTHFVIRTLNSIKVYAMNDSIVTEKAGLIGVFSPVPEDFNMKKVIVEEKDKSINVSITGKKADFKEFNDFQIVEE